MKNVNSRITAALVLSASAFAFAVRAAVVDQTITLAPGWNAVYVGVGPEATADEVFSSWPVEMVSAYNASLFRVTADNSDGLTGESTVISPFLSWTRETQASTLRNLSADTVLVCCNTNATSFTTTLRGTPAAPRIVWHTSGGSETYNYVGVRLADGATGVKATDYFAGCPSLASNPTFYKIVTGTDGTMGVTTYGGGFSRTGARSATLSDGTVLLVPGVSPGDWSGPLYVSPRTGVDFGESDMLEHFTIRNDGVTEKSVRIEYVASADGIAKPDLLFSQSATSSSIPEWHPFTNSVSRVLTTGAVWSVSLALDRTKLSGSGDAIGGIVRITEDTPTLAGYTGFKAEIPVSAVDRQPVETTWPQGLWRVKGALSSVNWQASESRSVEGVAAGGVMPVVFYVHVDGDGVVRLLQRAVIAGLVNTDGTITENIYGPDAAIPTDTDYSRRVSSAVLPVDMGAVASSSGEFGEEGTPLVFTYSIGPESPSNPFFHPLHPMFDNKRMDFETPAPDGDDMANYVGSVKPERFTIGGEVRLSFDENAGNAWSPDEGLSGECTWIYYGIRREGPLTATGRFYAERILPVSDITL